MAKIIYERQWDAESDELLLVPNGYSPVCFDLGFPWSILLQKIVCKQIGGTPLEFFLNIYNAQVCSLGGSSSSFAAGFDRDLCRVIPEQNVPVGTVLRMDAVDGGHGWPFINQMGTPTVPVKKIYVEITTVGQVDDCQFALALAGIPTTA